MSSTLLYLFVINLGIAFGVGRYEHRIVVSRVTTVPLTLLTLANLFAAWRVSSPVRFLALFHQQHG